MFLKLAFTNDSSLQTAYYLTNLQGQLKLSNDQELQNENLK